MVRLVPMTEDEFQIYCKWSIPNYAQEQVTAGYWDSSDALQKSEEELLQQLPDGLASKEQYFLSIEDSQTSAKIGLIWFGEKHETTRPSAFVYDFLIYEEYRKKGYGKQTLKALEEKVKELGIETISLHVFGHNKIAFNLYQLAGYEITGLRMKKKLSE